MKNQRRRRDILVIGCMLGEAVNVVKQKQYENLNKAGPLRMLDGLDKEFRKNVLSDAERAKELNDAKMVVNGVIPADYFRAGDELKLWWAARCVFELVRQGWRIPQGQLECAFVQELYTLCQSMGGVTLPNGWEEKAEAFPAKAKAIGLFRD